ncbi:phosphotransferase [Aestuariirhabdus litorea]|uniref:Aminoglycoside phosphotransferase domain-containing protein n=1 Tax=Aestuariirhabdus litorea TaxID=2528527 RepID=A0A3P3VR35_9GAMM|nr:phosphotransferase [Aestuariirhabdus litorea]RRJ85185.1 hypothetical protein D0544_09000 [Aestuariirhabdus litorea]RWW98406.1 hypothetical protein DZC74_08985 [Endozoicomonadaceae bacterium GTF-13]
MSAAAPPEARDDPRLRQVAAYLGGSPDWHPLPAGSSNRLYCASYKGQPLVLRLNAGPDKAVGVLREVEAAVLARLQGYPWAPQVLHNPWQQGWCLMRDHGQNQGAPVGDPSTAHKSDLLRAVAQWQTLDGIEGLPAEEDAELLARYRPALGGNPLWAELLNRGERLLTRLPPLPRLLTHHDLHPGNLCGAPGKLVVLDWEYAARGNPWFDGAALNREFSVSAAELRTLPAWQGLCADECERGLTQALWLNQLLALLWYAVRGDAEGGEAVLIQRAEGLLDLSWVGL